MSITFTKLFSSITASTVWCEDPETKVVWITMLAMSDRLGRISGSIPGLAAMARVSVDATRRALDKFLSPDPDSRSKEVEGRRIEVIDGGWRLINYQKYREMRDEEERKHYKARWARDSRQKRRQSRLDVDKVDRSGPQYTNAEADAEADAYKNSEKNTTAPAVPIEFEDLKKIYPKRAGSNPWPRALKACMARIREGSSWTELTEGVRRYQFYCQKTSKIGTEYVLQAATFFGPDKRFLEPWGLPATKADARLGSNLTAAEEFMRRTELRNGTG